MNRLRDYINIIRESTIKMVLYGLSISFLIIHILMLFFFNRYNVTPMVRFNCFSIVFYIASLYLIYHEFYRSYVISMYLEVLLHMSLAIIFVGWNSGFQITLIGINIIIYYGEYLIRLSQRNRRTAPVLSAIGLLCYLVTYIYTANHPSTYSLPDRINFFLNIMWAIIVFFISSSVMLFFVRITTHSEHVLSAEASKDKLTGLYNRRGYEKILTRINIATTILLIIDGDKFKEINDSYGHETGDLILKEIADTLTRSFRSNDYICRIGGDEFAVLIDSGGNGLHDMIRNKMAGINNSLTNMTTQLPPVSLSVGVSFGNPDTAFDELFNQADKALYTVKNSGGCGCAFYDELPL